MSVNTAARSGRTSVVTGMWEMNRIGVYPVWLQNRIFSLLCKTTLGGKWSWFYNASLEWKEENDAKVKHSKLELNPNKLTFSEFWSFCPALRYLVVVVNIYVHLWRTPFPCRILVGLFIPLKPFEISMLFVPPNIFSSFKIVTACG